MKFSGLSFISTFAFLSFSHGFADQDSSTNAFASAFSKNWSGYVPILLVFGVFYFLIIRPQNKKRKALEEMIANLKSGDKVIMHSGIFGSVFETKEDDRYLILEVSKGVKVKILKSAIAAVEPPSKRLEGDI